jgi:hypothetical protein
VEQVQQADAELRAARLRYAFPQEVRLYQQEAAGHPGEANGRREREFGRPDLSVHGVPREYREAVIDLFGRFIEFQAFGGVIEESQEVRMRTLPRGMTCQHTGDPDFNNAHVEISPPGAWSGDLGSE